MELPQNLRTAAFVQAWQEWEQHRREIRHTLTPTNRAKQLKRCAEYGPEKAIAALAFAIEGGWQSFCDPQGIPYVEQRQQQAASRSTGTGNGRQRDAANAKFCPNPEGIPTDANVWG